MNQEPRKPIVVEIENLVKDYEVGFWRKRKVRALDGLCLTVNQGEIFGFLGANGAGKTTTLKLLMRLIFPTEGSARILREAIAEAYGLDASRIVCGNGSDELLTLLANAMDHWIR